MTKLESLKRVVSGSGMGNYSDEHNTFVENGIEFGFGLVLGVSSAVTLILLMFFVIKTMFIG
ncbi:MAG: hypothetical protein ABIG84_02470 [archaeon]